MNYNELIKMLTDLGLSHLNVNSSDAGNLENLSFGSIRYPLTFFMCDELTYGNNSNEYKMIMLVGDLCDEKVAQQTNVQSNMLGITQNIVNKLLILSETSEVYQIIPESISSKPFIDNLPDLVAGWETSFTMRLKFNTECTLPFSS